MKTAWISIMGLLEPGMIASAAGTWDMSVNFVSYVGHILGVIGVRRSRLTPFRGYEQNTYTLVIKHITLSGKFFLTSSFAMARKRKVDFSGDSSS